MNCKNIFVKNGLNHKVWISIYKANFPKGTIVKACGSGEYRTVGMESSHDEAAWANDLGFNYICFDKFGCGESTGDWKTVTWEELINCFQSVAQFAFTLNQPVILMGHSEGAILSIEVAHREKEITAVISRSPSSQPLSDRLKMQLGDVSWEDWRGRVEQGNEEFISNNHARAYWQSRAKARLTADLIQEIASPVLVLNGDKDVFTPVHASKNIHDAINKKRVINKNSKAHYIKGAGHSLCDNNNWKESEAAQLIRDWLNEVIL